MRRPRSLWFVTIATSALVVLPTASAHAANTVDFCFNWEQGGAYQNKPTKLMYKDGGNWQYLRDYGGTRKDGCGTYYDVPTNKTVTVWAMYWEGHPNSFNRQWTGQTPYSAGPGRGRPHLGTGIVYCRGPQYCPR